MTKLPTVQTSFVGRQREVQEVTRLVADTRLVTLTGAAGCGKTRLALRVAREIENRYADGVHWIELARLVDPALVLQTVAKTLHVPTRADRPTLEALLDTVQEKQLLLVLDNCEHLLNACARLVERLLSDTIVSVISTSREPLSIAGESLYPVAQLSLPPPSLAADDVDGIAQYDAVRLFVERARARVPAFELTAENAGTIAAICRELDGIPLAIELASTRINVLTTSQIAARLDNHFQLLPSTAHVTYSHHDTLHAAIDWSYHLLSRREQRLLCRLTVFAGGCSLTAAESVCRGEDIKRGEMLELLSSLVDKSLIKAETLGRDKAHYLLLESVRQYAQEKLLASGEGQTRRDRHLDYFLQLTEETAPKLRGEHQQTWLNRLEDQYDNIRAALSWSVENDRVEAGLRIAIAIYRFWTVRDYMEEGATWLERMLVQADEGVSLLVRANALAYAGFLAEFRGDTAAQIAYGEKAAALAKELGNGEKPALAWALQAEALGARAAGDERTGFALYQRLVHLYRELGDRHNLGTSLTTCGIAAMSLGKYEEARALLDEALPIVRETEDPHHIAMLFNSSGDLARCQQDYVRAKNAYEKGISLLRDLDAARDLASILHNLGHTYLHLGDAVRARALFEESIALNRSQRNRSGIAECLIGFAALSIAEGLPAAGARLLAAAVTIGGERVATAWQATRLEYEAALAHARDRLAEAEFHTEQAAGRTLSLDEAVAHAQEVGRKAMAAQRARKNLDELTPREREVAALVARARSNSEIAEELVISKRTVEKHISNIRSKLAFTKRAQIVRWAFVARLVEPPDESSPS